MTLLETLPPTPSTRWNPARAAAVQDRTAAAISEYDKVRDLRVPPLTATLADLFRDAGAPVNVMKPFAHLRSLAEAGRLTLEDLVAVRAFFEELPRRPNARFRRARGAG